MSAPILEVRDLVVAYGAVEAVKGVSLEVAPGEVMAILGGNGAGKTTTLRAISGLIRPRSGEILLAGKSILKLDAYRVVEAGLSQVPEGRRIFSTLSVEENLNLGGYLQRSNREELRRRKARVYEAFPRLLERRGQLAGTLSGGEQQMLAIGRALMSAPRVLTLDEPSLGLSPLLGRRILRIVREIADTGVAVLLIEQNARQALKVADRACVLEVGRTVLSGTAAELAADRRVQMAYLGGFDELEPASKPAAG